MSFNEDARAAVPSVTPDALMTMQNYWSYPIHFAGGVMGILAWIIVGLIGGAIAQLLVSDDPIGGGIVGFIVTILVGIVGAVIAGFIAVALGISNGVDDFDIGSIFLSIVGAVLILVVWKAIAGGGRRGPLSRA
jgi:uncharacterized membrane protein YeaQ/YmgE (transglycosylase-associated protein family)